MSKQDLLQQINTNRPRETLAFSQDDMVIKRPVAGALSPKTWLGKQEHAKQVMDYLNQIGNSAYFVPEMLEISPTQMFTVERRAYGHPINSSYFDGLPAADQDIIYNAIAHFLNDINQSKPILNQSEFFDYAKEDGAPNTSFNDIIAGLRNYIPASELGKVIRAKEWFDTASKTDASVVFSHGDMNENNIFYDPERRMVSFIDFADAKYENIHYMFERDFGKLGWLDLDRIRREYMALPRKNPVVITTDKHVTNMRIALQNLKWVATEFLKSPNTPAGKVRLKLIHDEIDNIHKLYPTSHNDGPAAGFTHATNAIRTSQTSKKSPVIKKRKER